MIQEAYVSYEVAKLLKDKGFDVFGDGSYGTETEIHREYSPFGKIRDCSTSKPSIKGFPAPTHQMAMAWLREEKNLYIEIRRNLNTFYFKWYIQEGAEDRAFSEYKYESYEEAVEAALKYSLENLI